MAEFKDASLWMKLAFLFIATATCVDLHGFSTNSIVDGYNDVRSAMVIGFICLIVALILALCLVFLDEVNGNKIALIFFIIFALIAGIALVIGVAMWGRSSNVYGSLPTYPAMLLCSSGLLALLAGIFGILEVAGVKG